MPAGVPTTPASQAAYGTAAPDPLTQPLLDFIAAPPMAAEAEPEPQPQAAAVVSWPCTSCGSLNPFSTSECGACGVRFLAGTSVPPTLRVPLLGDLLQLSRARRLLAAAAAAIVMAMLFVVVLALLAAIVPG